MVYSRLLAEEAARLLHALDAETRIYDPRDLSLPEGAPNDRPKVQELRELTQRSEGMVSGRRRSAMAR